MTSATPNDAFPIRWYRSRIADPTTDDEAIGYWLFVVGVLSGIVGMALFLGSGAASAGRQWSIFFGAGGLALLVAGPVIRLPLQRAATYMVYAGLAIAGAAMLWFLTAFPSNWSTTTGNATIIGLYTLGIGVISVGGVIVPVLTAPVPTEEEERAAAAAAAQREAEEADRAAELDAKDAEIAELREERDALAERVDDESGRSEELEAERASLFASQARFELFEDKGGQYRWRLRHRNGNIVASSGEGYTARHNAQNGLESVRRNALGAELLRIEPDVDPEETEDEPFEPVAEESQAEFEIYQDEADEWRWRLVHDNGNVLGDSGEGYASKQGVRRGIASVQRNAGAADYLRIDPAAVEIYRDRADEWRWRLLHENGNVLGDGGEGYSSRRAARKSVDSLMANVAEGDSHEFELFEDKRGEYRWRVRHRNGNIVADSGEGYSSKQNAERAIERVREYLPEADVLDVGQAAFEIYEDSAEEYRWRLRHRNGNIIADGGEGYSSRSAAEAAVDGVKRNGPGAEIEE